MSTTRRIIATAAAPFVLAGCTASPDAEIARPLEQPEPEVKQTAEDLTTTTEAPEEATTSAPLTTLAVVLPTSPPTTIAIPETSIARGPLPVDASLTPYNGWAIPEYIVSCETGGTFDWMAYNPVSGASGPYQFLDSTWAGYGGYRAARDAPRVLQHERAAQLWRGGLGRSHWAECL